MPEDQESRFESGYRGAGLGEELTGRFVNLSRKYFYDREIYFLPTPNGVILTVLFVTAMVLMWRGNSVITQIAASLLKQGENARGLRIKV